MPEASAPHFMDLKINNQNKIKLEINCFSLLVEIYKDEQWNAGDHPHGNYSVEAMSLWVNNSTFGYVNLL